MLWKIYKHKQQKTTVFPGTFVEPKDEKIVTFLEKLLKLQSKAVVLHSILSTELVSYQTINHKNKQNFQILFEIY